MASRILGRAPGIGKRWPHRALNFLPSRQLWKYLAWKSGDKSAEPSFHLGKALNDCRRVLVVLPDDFQEILVALPVLQSLVHDLPGTEFQLLADQRDAPFLAAMFGAERILKMIAEDFFWGEAHFRELQRSIQAFRPDLILNLRDSAPALLCYLMRASRAPLRVRISGPIPGEQPPWPFANIDLKPIEPSNHLRRCLIAAALWNFSKRPVACKWSRLRPSPDNLREAAARLTGKGLKPESTRVFLWQGTGAVGASSFQRDVFRAAVMERAKPGESKSLVIVIATGAPFHGVPPAPEESSGIVCLEAESTGLLLGLFAQTARCIGLNGPLLHLASLTDADVEAHFNEEDAPWDTSFLNPRLKVIYRKPMA